MEDITLGQFGNWITLIVGLIAGVGVIYKSLKTLITKMLDAEFQEVNEKLDHVNSRINAIDLETCKNFLVAELAELDKGLNIDDVEMIRFYEQYDHYLKVGGNSYIKRKVEAMEFEGKLIRRN